MALRRGFKSDAERIARRVRSELGIGAAEPVALGALADLMGIEVRAGDELIPKQRFRELEDLQPGAFSACTLRPSADRTVVVYNPVSAKSRQTSDIAHELAHTLLDHDLSRIERVGDVTFLSCDPTQEEEAAWLSGCLLLPRPLLLAEVRKGSHARDIAGKYGVSERMAKYRMDVTGVVRQNQAFMKRRRTKR
ncbi:MAG: ImmA/IrrE family metallo-endopeptidase [Chloroflexota bacterium]|nr:ImmA/IrrE family metallo-endopeptidase [Chloroflexota bacterium]